MSKMVLAILPILTGLFLLSSFNKGDDHSFKTPIVDKKPETGTDAISLDSDQWKTLLESATHKVSDWFGRMKILDEKLIKNRTKTTSQEGKEAHLAGAKNQSKDHVNDISPNDYRIILSGRTDEIDELAQKAFVALEIASKLAKERNITGRAAVTAQLGKFNLPENIVQQYCPFYEYGRSGGGTGRNYVDKSHKNAFFRSSDGSFNNPFDPYKGRSNIPFHRLLPPFYYDGIQALRIGSDGLPLPSARKVSLLLHRWPLESSTRFSEFPQISLLMSTWGQIVGHDVTLAPLAKVPGSKCCDPYNEFNPNCAVIDISYDDPFYAKFGSYCMEFTRSSPSFRRDCRLGPKEILNRVTSYLDASFLYGSSEREERLLRIYINGEMRVRDKEYFQDIYDFLPIHPNGTQKGCVDQYCYFAGDVRVNENPGLTALHNLFLREHNRIARGLYLYNPHWNDERLFQEAKRIVIAEYQHINYNEYFPLVLGKKLLSMYPDARVSLEPEYYNGYSPDVDASISQVFTTAAFRFGHSMVADKLLYVQSDREKSLSSMTYLRESYFRPRLISGHNYPDAPDNVLLGLALQKSYIMDNWMSRELVDHLYQTKPSIPGLDLKALDIQRGRDVGIAGYNDWRVWCGLKPFKTFDELEQIMPIDMVEKFRTLYASVDDIDLVSAGDSEYWIYDSILGPTFACLMIEQVIRTRKGDRFWYENGPISSYGDQPIYTNPFTIPQLAEIKKIVLAKLLCHNSPLIKEIQPRAFLSVDYARNNQQIPCDSYAPIDLSLWKEAY